MKAQHGRIVPVRPAPPQSEDGRMQFYHLLAAVGMEGGGLGTSQEQMAVAAEDPLAQGTGRS